MNTIEATITELPLLKGQLNTLRKKGEVPGIVYGKMRTKKFHFQKKKVKNLLDKENFLSNVISLKIDGKDQNVIPREIVYDIITDEPIHLDFLRITKGSKIILEIPVKFINEDLSHLD